MLVMSVRAAVTRASSARSSTLGTIRAASTPMMTRTTISSISVKPRWTAVRRAGNGRRGRLVMERCSKLDISLHHNRAMVTLSLNRGQAGTWHVKAATFVLWLLAAGVVAFWAMRLGNGGAGAPVPPAPAEPLQVDAPALAQALGGVAAAQGAVAPAAAPVVSRYALVGVLAGRDSGGGAAVIAVGNQPAKPFRVGR